MYHVLTFLLTLIPSGSGMAVEIREINSDGKMIHAVYVQPDWVRPGSVSGPQFGVGASPYDLQVYVPYGENPQEDRDFVLDGCQHASGYIAYNTPGYIRLNRDVLCDYETDLPVSKINRIHGIWLGNRMNCVNWIAISENQPRGIRTFLCEFGD